MIEGLIDGPLDVWPDKQMFFGRLDGSSDIAGRHFDEEGRSKEAMGESLRRQSPWATGQSMERTMRIVAVAQSGTRRRQEVTVV
jgi:hypothetical protein